jgi:hypothetical protein
MDLQRRELNLSRMLRRVLIVGANLIASNVLQKKYQF